MGYRTLSAKAKDNPETFRLKKSANGYNLCRMCNKEVLPPRRTFCSGFATRYSWRRINGVKTRHILKQGSGCYHEFLIRNRPKYARNAVLDRDHGICSQCGLDCIELQNRLLAMKNSTRQAEMEKLGIKRFDKSLWEMHHIVPVQEVDQRGSGGALGLSNLITLCFACHRAETKQQAAQRAILRREKVTK